MAVQIWTRDPGCKRAAVYYILYIILEGMPANISYQEQVQSPLTSKPPSTVCR